MYILRVRWSNNIIVSVRRQGFIHIRFYSLGYIRVHLRTVVGFNQTTVLNSKHGRVATKLQSWTVNIVGFNQTTVLNIIGFKQNKHYRFQQNYNPKHYRVQPKYKPKHYRVPVQPNYNPKHGRVQTYYNPKYYRVQQNTILNIIIGFNQSTIINIIGFNHTTI